MATIGTQLTIVKLSGGYIRTDTGNKRGFSNSDELYTNVATLWKTDIETAVNLLNVDGNNRYALELSTDSGVTYFDSVVSTIVRLDNGATVDVTNDEEVGFETVAEAAVFIAGVMASRLIDMLNGVTVSYSVKARINES